MSNKFNEKHPKWLMPVLCLVVIFQSVMLFSAGSRGQIAESLVTVPFVGKNQAQPTSELVFVPESIMATKDQPVAVEIWLKPGSLITLGGMDLVLKFDPSVVTLTKIEAEDLFAISNINRQSEKEGRIFVTYLDDTEEGTTLENGQKLLSLTVVPKQSGQVDLGMITGGVGARTTLTDKASSQSLPISVGSLVITVSEK